MTTTPSDRTEKIAQIIPRLRKAAEESSRASKMLAAHKTTRNIAAGDLDAHYDGVEPYQTMEWEAAELFADILASVPVQGEVVAWQRRLLVDDGKWSDWLGATPEHYSQLVRDIEYGAKDIQVRVLYAAPLVQTPAQKHDAIGLLKEARDYVFNASGYRIGKSGDEAHEFLDRIDAALVRSSQGDSGTKAGERE